MVNKTEPAGGMLQEEIAPILHGFSAARQIPMMPQVFGLEVLINGQVDGIVGGIRRRIFCRGAGFFHVGGVGRGAAYTHGGAGGEPQQKRSAAVSLLRLMS